LERIYTGKSIVKTKRDEYQKLILEVLPQFWINKFNNKKKWEVIKKKWDLKNKEENKKETNEDEEDTFFENTILLKKKYYILFWKKILYIKKTI
jgi:hypothetical protein